MGAELSSEYNQRTRVTAARQFYVLIGLMLAAAVPMIIEIRADGGGTVMAVMQGLWNDAMGGFTGDLMNRKPTDRAALTGPVLDGLAWTSLVLLPLIAALVAWRVAEPPVLATQRVPIRLGFVHLLRNGPMKRVMIIALLVVFGESFRIAVSLFFIRDAPSSGRRSASRPSAPRTSSTSRPGSRRFRSGPGSGACSASTWQSC